MICAVRFYKKTELCQGAVLVYLIVYKTSGGEKMADKELTEHVSADIKHVHDDIEHVMRDVEEISAHLKNLDDHMHNLMEHMEEM